MDAKALTLLLEAENIPKRWYSINDNTSIVQCAKVIRNVDNKYWEYFYFDDRGVKDDYIKFDSKNNVVNESRACKFLLKKLLKTKENYIKVGLQLE